MTLKYGRLTIPPAAVLNAVGKPQPLALAGARALVPLVYGQTRATGRVLNVVRHATDATLVLVQVYWCHACNALSSHLLNDLALPGGASSLAGPRSTVAQQHPVGGVPYRLSRVRGGGDEPVDAGPGPPEPARAVRASRRVVPTER